MLFSTIQKNKPEISTLTDIQTLCEASTADDFVEILWQIKRLRSIFIFYGEFAAESERVKFAHYLKIFPSELAYLIPIKCVCYHWITL